MSRYWFVTDRIADELFLLRPDPVLNAAILVALCAAIAATGVGVVAFVVMGNHWHLVLRTTDDPTSLSRFMQLLKSSVALAVNEERDRHGPVWGDRYHAQPILDDESLLARMLYVLMNPVAAGIVATADEYPGLSSLEANVGIPTACGEVEVPIELPPQWAELDATELSVQRAWIRNELRRREAEAKASRIARGLARPKPERCLQIDPFGRPPRPDRKPAPPCFAATELARKAFLEVRRAFVEAFLAASEAFRSGVLDVMFPAGSFPPRLVRPPNEAPLS